MGARDVAERWMAGGGFDEAALADPALRRAVYVLVQADPRPYHDLLRAMLAMEAGYRSGDAKLGASDNGAHYDNLYCCGLLLFDIGDVTDAPALWAAKETDFDTSVGFDVQMIVGAGVDETIEFLSQRGTHADISAVEWIRGCAAAGDFDNLADWRAFANEMNFGNPTA